jgi:hypothetical protein
MDATEQEKEPYYGEEEGQEPHYGEDEQAGGGGGAAPEGMNPGQDATSMQGGDAHVET